MRKSIVYEMVAAVVLCVGFLTSCSHDAGEMVQQPSESSQRDPVTLMVAFDDKTSDSLVMRVFTKAGGAVATGISEIDGAFSSLGVNSLERVFPDAGEWEERHRAAGLHKYWYVQYDPSRAIQTKAGEVFAGVKGVSKVETVHKIKLLSQVPAFDDPYLSRQWHYHNPGSGSLYKAGADINVTPVWNRFTAGSSDVIVAVVDGGVDLTHEDLGPVVIPGGRNGSWNFVDNNANIVAHDHGTHVAGTIAAINNNGVGVCGVAGGSDGSGGVRVLSCQVFRTDTATGDDLGGNTASAIVWGADHGAVISQNSWGYDFETEGAAQKSGIGSADKAAVDYFIKNAGTDKDGNQTGPMKGGVVIFAAGNDNWSVGWPAAYDKVIAVGAMSSLGTRAHYSNYGSWVDIAAPGGDVQVGPQVLSTVPGGYDSFQGTSMACPHVSGVAALLVSYFGGAGFTADMLVERLLGGANAEFVKDSQIGPLVDAYGAFIYGDESVPERVEDYSVQGSGGRIEFDWTVGTSVDGTPAYGYLLLASREESDYEGLDLNDLPSAMRSSSVNTEELASGDAISGCIDGLEFSTDYYVAIAGYDYNRNYGELSEVKKVTTTQNSAPEMELITSLPWSLKATEKFTALFDVRDPDGHAFDVTVSSSPSLASLTYGRNSEGHYYVTVDGVQEESGEYKLVLEAVDKYGASTRSELALVILENSVPLALKGFDDQFFDRAGQSVSFMVSDYFSDPDGDALTFSMEHSNSKVAHLNSTGERFVLTTMNYGSDVITITAGDARGAAAALTLRVSVRDPEAEADVYPTRVTDILKVSGGGEADTSIKIYSSTGATVYENVSKSSVFSPAQVDMSGFAPGVYRVEVMIDGKKTVKPIVKL